VKRTKKKWKVLLWVTMFTILTSVQLGALYQLDRFLKPPSLEKKQATTAFAAEAGTGGKVSVPDDAIYSAVTPDNLHAAYVTSENDNTLFIENKDGTDSIEETGSINYLKWLGNSNTLLYMVEKRHSEELHLLQLHHEEPVLVHEWSDKDLKVQDVFFSPYLEFFYVHMKNGEKDEVYKYKASSGLEKISTRGVEIAAIDYDEKNDILYITNPKGKMWEYKDGSFHRSTLKTPKFS
jgi:hypothetical protein